MPSFDIVSEIDQHELTNALDQANREVDTRFDFKGSKANYELAENKITLRAQNEFQIKQMLDILQLKMAKRNIDLKYLVTGEIITSLNDARQILEVKQGIDVQQTLVIE